MMSKIKRFLKSAASFLWIVLLSGGVMAGLWAGYQVMTKGLIVTNLTDLIPWGLWIGIDLSSIALSAGAFSLCAVVYLVGLKEYEPVARTATFIGFIGYSMAMLCLFMDIGQPLRFWHGFVYWNVHSVLWEVTMCVGLYFSVLMLEVLPIIAEMDWMQRVFPKLAQKAKSIHRISPFLAILGLSFSLLHQSSLGATYGVLQSRPAWYRPTLAVLFIYSAVLGGISLTVFASMLASRVSKKAKINDQILNSLTRALGWGLLGYLYIRFWDTFSLTYNYQPGRSESLTMLTSGTLSFNFWILEIFLGAVVPIFIFLKGKWRENPTTRIFGLLCAVVGVTAYRWDTNMVGQMIVLTYLPREIQILYTQYFPSLIEILAGVGVVSYGFLAFTLGVRFLKIVDHSIAEPVIEESHSREKERHSQPRSLPNPTGD